MSDNNITKKKPFVLTTYRTCSVRSLYRHMYVEVLEAFSGLHGSLDTTIPQWPPQRPPIANAMSGVLIPSPSVRHRPLRCCCAFRATLLLLLMIDALHVLCTYM